MTFLLTLLYFEESSLFILKEPVCCISSICSKPKVYNLTSFSSVFHCSGYLPFLWSLLLCWQICTCISSFLKIEGIYFIRCSNPIDKFQGIFLKSIWLRLSFFSWTHKVPGVFCRFGIWWNCHWTDRENSIFIWGLGCVLFSVSKLGRG